MNAYYTHRDYLRKELENLEYSSKKTIKCLEFGTGDGSAKIFHEFAKTYSNLSIKAFDSDSSWVSKTESTYKLINYSFHHVKSWDELLNHANFNDNYYDLVFVDQAPWEARIKTINFIKDKSKTIILHDYDFYNAGKCEDAYSINEQSFFYQYNSDFEMFSYFELSPPTLVMKNNKLKESLSKT